MCTLDSDRVAQTKLHSNQKNPPFFKIPITTQSPVTPPNYIFETWMVHIRAPNGSITGGGGAQFGGGAFAREVPLT